MDAATKDQFTSEINEPRISLSLGATAFTNQFFATSISISDFVQLLTNFKIGKKDGDAFAPALFSGNIRKNENAERIELMGLDIDAGYPIGPIIERLRTCGIKAVVYTTFSHLATETRAPRRGVEAWRQRIGSSATDARYLREVKHYHPDIANSCTSHEEQNDLIIFHHAAIPKFRVVLPLKKAWVRTEFISDIVAEAVWRRAIHMTAELLGVSTNPSATDVARLFYFPRVPDEPARANSRFEILEGDLFDGLGQVDIADINSTFAKIDDKINQKSRSRAHIDPASVRHQSHSFKIIDPIDGRSLTLDEWLARWGPAFQAADAIAAGPFEDPETKQVFLWASFGWRTGALLCQCPNHLQHTIPVDKRGRPLRRRRYGDFSAFNASDTKRSSGFAFHCFHAHCANIDRKTLLELALNVGWISPRTLVDPRYLLQGRFDELIAKLEAANDPRPIIKLEPGEMAKVADAAEAVLIDTDVPFYNRGGILVTPYLVKMKSFHGTTTTSPALARVMVPMVLDQLTRYARCQRYDGRSGEYVPANPPKSLAETILNRPANWRFRRLSGIIATPSLRPDGSLLNTAGYDPETCLLVVDLPEMPAIPVDLSRQDALAALQVLDGLLDGFPFVNQASRSVALSALLTTVCRAAMEVAPMHVSSAPAPGTGKSYLWDLVSYVSIGQRCPVTTAPKSTDELEKRLDGSLLEGTPIICLDNVSEELGSDKLCVAIERPVIDIRRLGASDKFKVENRATLLATGNNLQLRGDVTRRALLAQRDAELERPEMREFKDRPHEIIMAARGKFIAAALTVVWAYIVAGRPNKRPPLASFEDWSKTVRESLVWLGREDPVATMVAARDEDPELAERREVIMALHTVFESDKVTVKHMVDAAEETVANDPDNQYAGRHQHYPQLLAALSQVAGDRGRILADKLGKWLRSNKGRIVGNLRLIRATGPDVSPAKWAIEVLQQTTNRASTTGG
jgi:putative DNA primase/helicase